MRRLILLIACLLCGSAQAVHNPALEHDAGTPGPRSEWWRLNASLADNDGRMWDLEWSLYRQNSQPRAADGGSQAGRMSLVHVAITTADGEHHEQRFEHGGILQAGKRAAGWEWVSQGATLFPARLSFSIGDRDLNLLLESVDPQGTAGQPVAEAIDHLISDPLIRVRGFVDRGAGKTYLRGRGRLDREWQTPTLAGNLADGD